MLILFLGVAAVWVRSYWIGDRFVLTSYRGPAARGQDFQNEIITCRGNVILVYRCLPELGDVGEPSIDYYPDEGISVGIFESRAGKLRFGFGAVAWHFGQGGGSSDGSKPNTETNIVFPLWFLELVLGIGPALWLLGMWTRTRGVNRAWRGLCAKCGYDVRASTQICPECGEAIKRDVKFAQSSWRSEMVNVVLGTALTIAVALAVFLGGRACFESKWREWKARDDVLVASEKVLKAIEAEDEDEVRRQLKAGAVIDATKGGEEMLGAIGNDHEKLALLWLLAGADPNAGFIDAAYHSQWTLVRRMVEKGAKPNVKDTEGKRPVLVICAEHMESPEDVSAVAALLGHGADPNLTDSAGDTALHKLTEHDPMQWNRLEFAKLLVEHGADVHLRNKAGKTAYELAKARECEELAAYLAGKIK